MSYVHTHIANDVCAQEEFLGRFSNSTRAGARDQEPTARGEWPEVLGEAEEEEAQLRMEAEQVSSMVQVRVKG